MKRFRDYLLVAFSAMFLFAGCVTAPSQTGKSMDDVTPEEYASREKQLNIIKEDILKMAESAGAAAKITELTELTAAPDDDDIVPIVDVSDTTMAATGTTKKLEIDTLMDRPAKKLENEASSPNVLYFKTALTSAADAMDDLSVSDLNDGDGCIVVTGNVVYMYQFDSDATDAEDSPAHIRPDDYSSQGVWDLVEVYASGMNLVAGDDPYVLFRDTSAPGDDKDMGKIKIVYADGGDGSENADILFYITQGGAEDTLVLQFDESDNRWELPSGVKFSTGSVQWTNSGDDYISGDALGDHAKEVIGILVYDDGTDTAVEDGAGGVFFRIPEKIDGWNLTGIAAQVQTAGTTGNLDIMIYNVTDSQDMLSTAMRIETGETDTDTSAQQGTINTSYDDVAEADSIRIDIDAIQTGTAAKGLWVELTFTEP